MTTQQIYHPGVDHPPRLFEHGLPLDPVLGQEDLDRWAMDPFWEYELIGGALLVRPRHHQLTATDLESFPRFPNWKYELLEGTLIVSPNAPGVWHQSCALSLAMLFRNACPPQLKVMIAPFEVRPVVSSSLQPDVLIARRPIGLKRLTQVPVLVVEVLLPSTKVFDRTKKRAEYQELGVEHFWIVDPAGPSIEVLRLVDGVYEIAAKGVAGQPFEVSEPVPLSFDPQELLDE